MAQQTTYSIAHQAYLNLILHATKYPHQPVNGVLLGKIRSGSGSGATVDIVTTVPLLHNWTTLSPMMEIGLDLAQTHASELPEPLQLVGYYQALVNETDNKTSIGPTGEKILSNLRKTFPQAIGLLACSIIIQLRARLTAITQIELDKLIQTPFTSPAVLAFPSNVSFALANPESSKRVLDLVREKGLQQSFGDFDDHLEDVKIDWLRNTGCKDEL